MQPDKSARGTRQACATPAFWKALGVFLPLCLPMTQESPEERRRDPSHRAIELEAEGQGGSGRHDRALASGGESGIRLRLSLDARRKHRSTVCSGIG